MSKLIVTAILVLASAAAAAQVADPARLRKTVDGYRFELVVEAILDPSLSARDSVGYEHRVTLTVRQPKIGHPVQLAAATLDVAERGHPAHAHALTPIASPEGPAYQAIVRMAVKERYRIVVHATPQGTSRALTAQFDYRHHH